MRIRLMTAAAIGSLCALSLHGAGWAQTTISNTTTTAVSTNGSDLDIAAAGTVNPPSGTAVTINTNNVVTVEGSIAVNAGNGAIGILAQPGVTSSITSSGTIGLNESFTPTVNNDGFSQAPFASASNRFGIETLGAFNGSITNSGSILVHGNNSYGIAVMGGLTGNIASGTVTLTGDQGYGLFTSGEVTGGVGINGAVSVQGAGSVGVATTGKIDGALTVYSTISTTGYASSTRPTTVAELNLIQAQPSQIQQGGQALWVQGSVGGGVFLGAPPPGTVSTDTTTDADADGVIDSVEGTSSLQSFGSAPGLQIGGSSPITLGEFGACNSGGAGNNCFGLIVEGTIDGEGVYDGVTGTAVDIGLGPNGATAGVNILGGIRFAETSSITASAYQANATGVQIESGVTSPILQTEGIISASATSNKATSVYGILIQPGANIASFANTGAITVGVTGDSASVYGLVDRSGTITNVANGASISVGISPATLGDTTTGSTVALDLHYNTTGVTFLQQNTSATPSITGDVLLSPVGPNNVQILQGSVTGALSLGANAGTSLLIDNGATFAGQLAYTGTGLNITVNNGTLTNDLPSTITGSSLTVGATGKLVVALDPLKQATLGTALAGAVNSAPVMGTSTLYKVGTATLASGATIGVTFLSTPVAGQTFTVIQASTLNVGGTNTSLLAAAPFLFTTTAQANPAAGTVTVTVQPKTASQLGLNKAETAALPAIYASLNQDSGIQNAIINAPTNAAFNSAYRLMLPDSSGDVFQAVSNMSQAIARVSVGAAGFGPSGSPDEPADEELQENGGLWASEFIFGVNQTRGDNEAYRGDGLGLVGGLDFGGFGADLAFATANIVKPQDPGDSIVSVSRLEAGLYGAPSFGILKTEMRLAAAYLKVSDRREFAASVTSGDLSTTTTVSRTANGDWTGYDFSGRLGAGAQFDLTDHFFIMPQAHLDVLSLHEGAYSETGGGQGFDLNVTARSSTESSITAGLVAGLHFGSTFVFRPQLELGWDEVLSGGPGMTTARFAYGGSSFTLPANAVTGGAAVARLSLKGDGEFVHFAVEAGGEFRSDYQDANIRAVFRISY